MAAETLYSQDATHFTLRFVLKPGATVEGQLVLELADTFQKHLIFPGSPPASIWTKSPGIDAQLKMVDYSDRAWTAAVKKLRANECAVLRLEARTTDFPNQTIAFYAHANPPGGAEVIQCGSIDVTCSVPYLRHLAASREKCDALIRFGVAVWNTVTPAYGFANLANTPKRKPFAGFGGAAPRLGPAAPPGVRAHAIPIAQTGSDIDGNLDVLIAEGRGIKGAYWANYLSGAHVAMAGGQAALRQRLQDIRIEPLSDGGVLIVAADSPLPVDSDENRSRFERVEAALRPAFLSRDETPERKRDLLGYFFRENK
ncbi:MAG TPA: type VI immunity family protein [Vicinamibacterales bacterium]|nr:type VI immunity family protein [Vicinamibacterales bacterium]